MAKAITLALQREDAKMVGVEEEARLFSERFLQVHDITPEYVMFKHKRPTDNEQMARVINTMVPDLPFRYRVMLCPEIPAEMHDEIIEYQAAFENGMTDKDKADYEQRLEA